MSARALLHSTAANLYVGLRNETFIDDLTSSFRIRLGTSPGAGEITSWRASIPTIVTALVAEGLEDVEVLVEVRGPLTNHRIDLVLVGSHPQDGQASVVVVENKQWSSATPVAGSELVHVAGLPEPVRLHPANQAWAYCLSLTNYLAALESAHVYALVNLHNAVSTDIRGITPGVQSLDPDVVTNVRVYGSDQRSDMRSFLRAVLSPTKAALHADCLLKSPVRPTRALMSAVSEAVLNRSAFTLLDEQRLAYDHVLRAVRESHANDVKEAILIVGGPGTGKSVIAVELLGTLTRLGIPAVHATGSKSFTGTLRDQIATTQRRAKQIFTYFNNYANLTANDIPVLIADEAHRIRHSSNHRYTPRDRRSTKRQVEELLSVARVPVFLLDEHQIVRQGEEGSVALIREAAHGMGIQVTEVRLRDQFRCGGCPEYIDWVEELLGLVPGGPRPWTPLESFDLRVADTPEAMESYLHSHISAGHTGRIAAGYCWPWSDAATDGSLVDDVVIGTWRRPWNSSADRVLNGIPPTNLWATHPGGEHQIGCIYTAQGLEYDYAGAIFGNDLVWRNGAWMADKNASYDPPAKRSADFAKIVRNTYKVLATRGMQGAILYSVDPETRALFNSLNIPKV